MLNNNNIKHKKKAQHVVELALLMPLFIILFCFAFQIMVETFSQCRFAYVFANSVKSTINSEPVFENMDEFNEYMEENRLIEDIQQTVTASIGAGSGSVFETTNVSLLNTEIVSFFVGAFQYRSKTIFLNNSLANTYFFFNVPINTAYVEPMVLNLANVNLEYAMNDYYQNLNGVEVTTTEEETGDDSEEGGGGSEGGEGEGDGEGEGGETPTATPASMVINEGEETRTETGATVYTAPSVIVNPERVFEFSVDDYNFESYSNGTFNSRRFK